MRIAFMGTPPFAVPTLAALHAAGHEIVAVYTQPPRPAQRGKKLQQSAVHLWAEAHGLPVRSPKSLRTEDAQAEFAALDLDVAVVAAYGLILPQAILDAPREGCLNVHGSILPRWRGAAPVQRAILAGDTETGVTIMQMDAGLDTGAMLLASRVPIGSRTTAVELHDTLAKLGARLIVRALAELPPATPQPEQGATYAPKLTRADGVLDWGLPAEQLDRRVRALNPWPGTFTSLHGTTLKVLEAMPCTGSGAPGTVLNEALEVACGTHALRLLRVQLPGRGALPAADFLRGHPIPPGTVLGG